MSFSADTPASTRQRLLELKLRHLKEKTAFQADRLAAPENRLSYHQSPTQIVDPYAEATAVALLRQKEAKLREVEKRNAAARRDMQVRKLEGMLKNVEETIQSVTQESLSQNVIHDNPTSANPENMASEGSVPPIPQPPSMNAQDPLQQLMLQNMKMQEMMMKKLDERDRRDDDKFRPKSQETVVSHNQAPEPNDGPKYKQAHPASSRPIFDGDFDPDRDLVFSSGEEEEGDKHDPDPKAPRRKSRKKLLRDKTYRPSLTVLGRFRAAAAAVLFIEVLKRLVKDSYKDTENIEDERKALFHTQHLLVVKWLRRVLKQTLQSLILDSSLDLRPSKNSSMLDDEGPSGGGFRLFGKKKSPIIRAASGATKLRVRVAVMVENLTAESIAAAHDRISSIDDVKRLSKPLLEFLNGLGGGRLKVPADFLFDQECEDLGWEDRGYINVTNPFLSSLVVGNFVFAHGLVQMCLRPLEFEIVSRQALPDLLPLNMRILGFVIYKIFCLTVSKLRPSAGRYQGEESLWEALKSGPASSVDLDGIFSDLERPWVESMTKELQGLLDYLRCGGKPESLATELIRGDALGQESSRPGEATVRPVDKDTGRLSHIDDVARSISSPNGHIGSTRGLPQSGGSSSHTGNSPVRGGNRSYLRNNPRLSSSMRGSNRGNLPKSTSLASVGSAGRQDVSPKRGVLSRANSVVSSTNGSPHLRSNVGQTSNIRLSKDPTTVPIRRSGSVRTVDSGRSSRQSVR